MEPSVAISAVVASVAGSWIVLLALVRAAALIPRLLRGAVGAIGERLHTRFARPVNVVSLLVTLLVGPIGRPLSAGAEVPPPLERLAPSPPGAAPNETPTETPLPAELLAPRADVSVETYEVVRGDSLWAIACGKLRERAGSKPSNSEIDRAWREIYEHNEAVIGDNPDLIFPGQILELPHG